MCGRYALHASENEIVSHFHLRRGFAMHPRYNIAPTQTIPIIIEWGKQVEFSRWGFIPSWAKSPDGQIPLGHINARIESLTEKPTFKEAIKKQRCLIPASGYFEWRTFGGKKHPYYIYIKNQPLLAFAGIWSSWRTLQGDELRTCAIITSVAPQEFQMLHDRLPVIISCEQYQNWLGKEYAYEEMKEMFFQPSLDNIGIKPVSPRMSHPRFEGIECIQSLS